MRFWLDRGVDGFRVDVAHKMAHDPELRDNPLVELDERGPGRDPGGQGQPAGQAEVGPPPGRGLAGGPRDPAPLPADPRRLRRPHGRRRGLPARPGAAGPLLRLRPGRVPPGPQLRVPVPAVEGRGLPVGGRRVQRAAAGRRLAGLDAQQPRRLPDRQPLRRGRQRPGQGPGGGHAAAHPARHPVRLHGRRDRPGRRRDPARPGGRRRRPRPRAHPGPVGRLPRRRLRRGPLAAGGPRGGQGQRGRPARRPGLHAQPVPAADLVPQGLGRPPRRRLPLPARHPRRLLRLPAHAPATSACWWRSTSPASRSSTRSTAPTTGRLELSTDPARALGEPVGLHPLRLGPDEGVVVRL